ncbi:MAG: response regulator transcription factor [Actinomycetota bacterium]|nr:response regulator transcription factor [Actinomycetota bacterium]
MKLLLAEEPDQNRMALRTTLAAETTFDLVGEASTAQEALDLIGVLRPEVVLMAPTMPDMTGAEATVEIMRRYPGTQVIALMADESDVFGIEDMLAAGACGSLSLRLRPLALNLATRS